jgi:cell division protein FtsB
MHEHETWLRSSYNNQTITSFNNTRESLEKKLAKLYMRRKRLTTKASKVKDKPTDSKSQQGRTHYYHITQLDCQNIFLIADIKSMDVRMRAINY